MGNEIKMLTFCGHPLSPFARMVHMTLEMLEIEYEFKKIDLSKGEQKEEWYLKINPKGAVPAIKDGDFCLTESHVIMKYLCNKKGETSLYPSDNVIRAKIDEALARVGDIKFACFLPKLFGKIDEVPAEKVTEFEESLNAFLAPYKKNADATGYLFGDSITIADIAMIMRLTMCRMAGYKWDKYPNMQKMSTPKNDASTTAFKKVNQLVIKVVESGTGNLSVLGGF